MRYAVIFALALALAAPAAARAEESSGPIKWLMKKSTLATDTPEPKDFVKESRPPEESLRYIGIGEKRPERDRKPLDKAGVKSQEGGFDALKGRNERIMAGKPVAKPPPTLPPAALKAKADYEAAMKAKATN